MAATIALAAQMVILVFCLLLPDLLLRRVDLFADRQRLRIHGSLLALISLLLVSGGFNPVSVGAVVFLWLMNALWQSSLAYFGVFLRPEDFIMIAKPDHFRDVVSVSLGQVRRMRLLIATLLASLGFSLIVIALPGTSQGGIWTPILAWAVMIGRAVEVAYKRRDDLHATIRSLPGSLGGLYALAVAVAWQVSPVKPLPGRMSYRSGKAGHATIAIIMGESINPSRMDLFRPGRNTTPNLLSMAQDGGRHQLIAKRGLSAGVASNSSVTGLLDASPFPWRADGARSLFDLASRQGFDTHYWSAQTRSPIELLDGGRNVDDEFCWEHDRAGFAGRKDWLLVDRLRAWPAAPREFFFIFPRCNHAPYFCHGLDGQPNGASGKAAERSMVEDYDDGLRVFDKLVADLVEAFRARGSGDLFIFITSDHNEMLGEDGLTGHNLSDHAVGAFVPFLLYTNRPEHEVAQAFRSNEAPDAYFLSALVMSIMGIEPEIRPEPEKGVSYVCNGLPFGRSGYMRLSEAPGDMYRVEHFNRSGDCLRTSLQGRPAPGS